MAKPRREKTIKLRATDAEIALWKQQQETEGCGTLAEFIRLRMNRGDMVSPVHALLTRLVAATEHQNRLMEAWLRTAGGEVDL